MIANLILAAAVGLGATEATRRIGYASHLIFLGAIGGLFSVACHSAPTPTPSPGGSPELTPTTVYNELVDAGCMQADPSGNTDGLASIAAEHAAHDQAWLECLFDGGTIKACAAPCGP